MASLDEKILVTGATGFIGRHLCRRLIGVGATPIPFEGDVRNVEDLNRYTGVQTIIHLAARVRGHFTKEETEEVNVSGTENVLRFASQQNADVIHASSYLYASAGDMPLNESTATTYWNHYSFTKWQAEQLVKRYCEENGLNVLVLRIFNAYGPEQQLGYLIPDLIDGLKKGCLKLKNTSPRRDFVHVDDIVELIIRANEKGWTGCEPVNVGTGVGFSVQETIDFLMELTGQNIPVASENKPVAIGCAIADISKAKNNYKWTPRIDFREGLKEILKREGLARAGG